MFNLEKIKSGAIKALVAHMGDFSNLLIWESFTKKTEKYKSHLKNW